MAKALANTVRPRVAAAPRCPERPLTRPGAGQGAVRQPRGPREPAVPCRGRLLGRQRTTSGHRATGERQAGRGRGAALLARRVRVWPGAPSLGPAACAWVVSGHGGLLRAGCRGLTCAHAGPHHATARRQAGTPGRARSAGGRDRRDERPRPRPRVPLALCVAGRGIAAVHCSHLLAWQCVRVESARANIARAQPWHSA